MKLYKFKYLLFYAIILSSLIFGSCTDLRDTSYSSLLADEYSPTDDDATAIVDAAYTYMRNVVLLNNGYWRANEICADEVALPARPNGWVDGGIYRRMAPHTWATDDDIVYETWARAYAGISSCNRVLYQIDSNYFDLGDDETGVVSELKVLRSYYYYVLCDMYGNVPLDTVYDVEDGFLPEQNTRQEVYNFIVKEIKENVDNLSTDVGGTYYNRFNQWSARTLLAKMYLNAEVYTGTADWDDCLEQCNKVIAIEGSDGYELDDTQKDVFATENEDSPEIIFGIAIDESYTTDWNTFDLHMQTLEPASQATYDLSSTPWGGISMLPEFINTFDTDDKRYTDNFIYGPQYDSGGDVLYCTLENTDTQLDYTNTIEPLNETSGEADGYRLGKFEIASGSSNILNNDFPLFRYADVLMMKAECLLRTGDADGAATIVNEVRSRNFDDYTDKSVTGSDLEGESSYDYGVRDGEDSETHEGGDFAYGGFLDELGWEFNQEGRTRQDMIRFGVFATKSYWGFEGASDGSKDYTNIYPIPQTALDSNSKLSQNSGY